MKVGKSNRSGFYGEKIRNGSDFRAIFGQNKAIHTRSFVILCHNRPGQRGRFAVMVKKKVGNAVHRNRIKRWIRHYWIEHARDLAQGRDLLFIAKIKAREIRYADMFQEFKKLTRYLAGQEKGKPGPASG